MNIRNRFGLCGKDWIIRASARGVLGAIAIAAITLSLGFKYPEFVSDVGTNTPPWTSTKFLDNSNDFRFAVVSDKGGGSRRGVFRKALEKLNLLRPEFVISVGDFIEGHWHYTPVPQQWDEFDAVLGVLNAPFFRVVGNHDISKPGMDALWNERYGRLYYFFIYKDVLFLCLNAQEGGAEKSHGGGLKPDQIQWAKQVLKDHPDVRWTCVFLHQPLWNDKDPGWEDIENSLKERPYTVFCGHSHVYVKYVRQDRKYIMLAKTGANGSLRGPEFGEFDEVAWVTMTDGGPVIANLVLDGILDEDIVTEAKASALKNTQDVKALTRINIDGKQSSEANIVFALTVTNTFKQNLQYSLTWNNTNSNWNVVPAEERGDVAPGEAKAVDFQAKKVAVNKSFPVCETRIAAGDKVVAAGLAMENAIRRQVLDRPVIAAPFFNQKPAIDGELNDGAWLKAKKIDGFEKAFGGEPDVKTVAFVGYDNDNLYIAFKCDEPEMEGLEARATNPGYLHKGDFVEVAIDIRGDRKTYRYLRVNPLGTVDSGIYWKEPRPRMTPIAKAVKGDKAWMVEMEIPWKNIETAPPKPGTVMGIFLARLRFQSEDNEQYPPLYEVDPPSSRDPAMFADLTFGPAQ